MDDRNSMMYWYPLIKNLDIPQPKTRIVPLEHDHREILETVNGSPLRTKIPPEDIT
jgi:hypothetical protein